MKVIHINRQESNSFRKGKSLYKKYMHNDECAFNKICWHDGLLKSYCVYADKEGIHSRRIELSVAIYKNSDMIKRKDLTLVFENVRYALITCDFQELVDNYGAGNISYGYEKSSKDANPHSKNLQKMPQTFSTYRLYLVDGYIEIIAERVYTS